MRKSILCIVLLAIPAVGTLWAHVPLDVRIDEADLVVVGTIVNESPGPPADLENVVWEDDKKFSDQGFQPFGSLFKTRFGRLKVDEVLKGASTPGYLRLNYGSLHSDRSLGDEGIWILRWDPKTKAYRCDYPWDRLDHSAHLEVLNEIKAAQNRRYSGPVDGLQLFAEVRNNEIAQGQDCTVSVGLHNAGPELVLYKNSHLDVFVDDRLVQTQKGYEGRHELPLPTAQYRRTFLGVYGETVVSKQALSQGKHTLRCALHYPGGVVTSQPMQVEVTAHSKPKPRADFSSEPDRPLWPVSEDRDLRFSKDGSHLMTANPWGASSWNVKLQQPVFQKMERFNVLSQEGELICDGEVLDSASGKRTRHLVGPKFDAVIQNRGLVQTKFGAEIWSLEPTRKVQTVVSAEGGVHLLSPLSRRAAGLNRARKLSVYSEETGARLFSLSDVTAADFDPQGRLLCGFSNGDLQVEGGPRWSAASGPVNQLRSDRLGQRFATSSGSQVRIWDSSSHQPVLTLEPGPEPDQLDFSPNGELLAVLVNGEAQLYSVPDGKRLHHFRGCTPGKSLAWNSDSSEIAWSGANTVTKWSLTTGRPSWWATAMKAGPVSYNPQKRFEWWDYQGRHVDSPAPATDAETPFDRTTLRDGEHVLSVSDDYVVVAGKRHLRVLDKQGQQLGQFDQVSEEPRRELAAVSPDQRWLARLNDDNYIEIFALPNLTLTHTLGRQYYAAALAWRGDSAQLAVSANAGVCLWNISTGELDKSLESGGIFTPLSYSPDGRYLAQGLVYDASISLWDVKTYNHIANLASYGKEWVVLASDGRFEASENADGYLLNVDLTKRTKNLLPQLLSASKFEPK